ncbi:GNAT family N-acetyltransferase [Metabacillus iocasae]|uniref:GNAT family N-acyltransferase n=1 Tax=Priestia iocasae TaxID=2291674 RepID=A0ABS2QSW4_9BACI|nr:GNAT family N-acetyltransferase [Metabacillus iocasae]MBM7702524.1 putative GNAT family N-acyltransferase [Metabacillus iocasae]
MNILIADNEKQRNDAYAVRKQVFVDEQNVPIEEEIDQHEDEAAHIVVYDQDQPVGAGRFRVVDGYGKVERICVLSSHRKYGVGKQIMLYMEQVASAHDVHKLKLNAQTQAEGFYQKLGYETVSGEFLDAGIPHVTMVRSL